MMLIVREYKNRPESRVAVIIDDTVIIWDGEWRTTSPDYMATMIEAWTKHAFSMKSDVLFRSP